MTQTRTQTPNRPATTKMGKRLNDARQLHFKATEVLRDFDLNIGHFLVLDVLWAEKNGGAGEGLRAREIERRLDQPYTNAAHHIAWLEEKGLVERKRVAKELIGRTVKPNLNYVTAQGEEFYREVVSALSKL